MTWRKSSYSGCNGNCVEVADLPAWVIAVRDSKDPDGPVLTFTPGEWQAFFCALSGPLSLLPACL